MLSLRFCVCVIMVLVVLSEVRAQPGGHSVEGSGVVERVRDLHAYVRDSSGEIVILDFNEERVDTGVVIEGLAPPSAKVVGRLDPAILQQGLMVSITGMLRRLAEFSEPVKEIVVTGTRLDPNGSYGLFRDDSVVVEGVDLSQGLRAYTVSGQITQTRGNQLTILAPTQRENQPATIVASVSPEVVVRLDSTDFSLVREGDRVEYEGWNISGNHVFAFNATFTKPLPEGFEEAEGDPRAEPAPAPIGPRRPFGVDTPEAEAEAQPPQHQDDAAETAGAENEESPPSRGRALRIN